MRVARLVVPPLGASLATGGPNPNTGTALRPRLSIFRSNAYTYVQLIDDAAGTTLCSVSTREKDGKKKQTKTDAARALGVRAARIAKTLNIDRAVFDRGSYKYHGRVRAVAEGARSAGLEC